MGRICRHCRDWHPRENYSILIGFGEFKSRFRFRWIPTVVFALPIPLLVYLGLWQVDRAAQKSRLAKEQVERAQMPPFELDGNSLITPDMSFRKVKVRGQLEAKGRIFIENRKHGDQTGFHVVTPLRLEQSQVRILVNQGWIPATKDQSIPALETTSDRVEVIGWLEKPSPPALSMHIKAEKLGNRWPYLTIELFSSRVPYEVFPYVILQDSDGGQGFIRNWTRPAPLPEMHIGYAIQWFAFAIIALVFYIRLSLADPHPETPDA